MLLEVTSEPELSAHERAALAAMWNFRALGEQETAADYELLAQRLREERSPVSIVERVLAAATDESRHRDLCAKLAARFGHAVVGEPPKLRRIAPHDLEGRPRLAYEMTALFCVTESINATLLLRSREKTRDPETRDILHTLLADEVEHSRIGWAYLSSEVSSKSVIAERMPRILDATTHDPQFLSNPNAPPPSAAAAAHGMLAQVELRAVFLEAMTDVVLPGLQLCGVDTGEAERWLERLRGRWESESG